MKPATSLAARADGARLDAAADAPWAIRHGAPGQHTAGPCAHAGAGERAAARRRVRRLDPRLYQITILSALLIFGVTTLDFPIRPVTILVALGGTLLTQYAFTRLCRLPAFDPKSPLISGLSLCLLLRANSLALVALAAAVTIAAKFVLRWNGKHLFNPTNFGLVAMMLATGAVWVSPGQWGSVAFFAFLLACLGGLVVNRAARSDVTYAFLVAYVGILFGRALWLGMPMAIRCTSCRTARCSSSRSS